MFVFSWLVCFFVCFIVFGSSCWLLHFCFLYILFVCVFYFLVVFLRFRCFCLFIVCLSLSPLIFSSFFKLFKKTIFIYLLVTCFLLVVYMFFYYLLCVFIFLLIFFLQFVFVLFLSVSPPLSSHFSLLRVRDFG